MVDYWDPKTTEWVTGKVGVMNVGRSVGAVAGTKVDTSTASTVVTIIDYWDPKTAE